MLVYRICNNKHSKSLKASGITGRWNSSGKYVIYTASSRALACLENVVHRSGEGYNALFKTVVIEIPEGLKITEVDTTKLPKDWTNSYKNQFCRKYGDEWIDGLKSCILKVPSAIIPFEHNYVINTIHQDFKLIKIHHVEEFKFDSRL